jgi:hypothetical protein
LTPDVTKRAVEYRGDIFQLGVTHLDVGVHALHGIKNSGLTRLLVANSGTFGRMIDYVSITPALEIGGTVGDAL